MKRKTLILSIALLCMSFVLTPEKKTTIWLMGDSTMAQKERKVFPETGWGIPFAYFFDSTVTVNNIAQNGRSTRRFIEEKYWQKVQDGLQEGDYVLIQFGHNDAAQDKPDRYTTPDDYKKNLAMFIDEIEKKHAHPILLTPVSRRKFDKEGNVMETHAEYAPLVHEVAKAKQVPLIDLDSCSKALYQKFGEENSKLLFLQLQPGENPNYPDGRNDNTHFTELGARKIAEIVLQEIRKQNIPLIERVVKGIPAK